MNLTYLEAKEKLLTNSDKECQQFFKNNNCILEMAYYELLHKNCKKAHELFLSISEEDIRAKWGVFLTGLCCDTIIGYPSYMQIRNFFEIDMQLLLSYYLGDYVEIICNYSEMLSHINSEIYKYLGRVFIKNHYDELGLKYLTCGENYFYNDPELHYLFAEYYFNNHSIDLAKIYLDKCLRLLPQYYPAVSLLNKIK